MRDTFAPTLSGFGFTGPFCLWPPNHKYVVLRVDRDFEFIIEDNCDPDPRVVFTGATSDQPDNANGDGNTVNDAVVFDAHLCLASERQGGDPNGRLYSIGMEARDVVGNGSDPTMQVRVAHDQSNHDCPALGANEFVERSDPVCQPAQLSTENTGGAEPAAASCSQSPVGIWAALLGLLGLVVLRRRNRRFMVAAVMVLLVGCSDGGSGSSNFAGGTTQTTRIALPADVQVERFAFGPSGELFICAFRENPTQYELWAYSSITPLEPMSTFGDNGVVATDYADPNLMFFGRCGGLTVIGGQYVAVWVQQGGLVFDLSGDVVANLSGSAGGPTTSGDRLLDASISLDGTTTSVSEYEYGPAGLVQTGTATLPVAAQPVTGDVDAVLFAAAYFVGSSGFSTPGVAAYDSTGSEVFRIWDEDAYGDEQYAHCSVMDVVVTATELYTLDRACDRLRAYDRASGGFVASIELPAGTPRRVGRYGDDVFVLVNRDNAQELVSLP